MDRQEALAAESAALQTHAGKDAALGSEAYAQYLAAVEAYNNKVNRFNEDVDAYNEAVAVYNAAVDAYNQEKLDNAASNPSTNAGTEQDSENTIDWGNVNFNGYFDNIREEHLTHIDVKYNAAASKEVTVKEDANGVETTTYSDSVTQYTVTGVFTDKETAEAELNKKNPSYGLSYSNDGWKTSDTQALKKDAANDEFGNTSWNHTGESLDPVTGDIRFYVTLTDSNNVVHGITIDMDANSVYAEGSYYKAESNDFLKDYVGKNNKKLEKVIIDGVEYYNVSGESVFLISALTCDGMTKSGKGTNINLTAHGLDLILNMQTLIEIHQSDNAKKVDYLGYELGRTAQAEAPDAFKGTGPDPVDVPAFDPPTAPTAPDLVEQPGDAPIAPTAPNAPDLVEQPGDAPIAPTAPNAPNLVEQPDDAPIAPTAPIAPDLVEQPDDAPIAPTAPTAPDLVEQPDDAPIAPTAPTAPDLVEQPGETPVAPVAPEAPDTVENPGEAPEAPVAPEAPDAVENPGEAPEAPVAPEAPDTVENPGEAPEAPVAPEAPDAVENPGEAPEAPVAPEAPGAVEKPGEAPEAPVAPEAPDVVGEPGEAPEAPVAPEAPDAVENPGEAPEAPIAPEAPDAVENPGEAPEAPVAPEAPEAVEKPTAPTNPGEFDRPAPNAPAKTERLEEAEKLEKLEEKIIVEVPPVEPDPTPIEEYGIELYGDDSPVDEIIPDEDVPLAVAPKTGDISALWAALSMFSLGGAGFLTRKRKDD